MRTEVYIFIGAHADLRGMSLRKGGDDLPCRPGEAWRLLAVTFLSVDQLRRYTLDPVLACSRLKQGGSHIGRVSAEIVPFPTRPRITS
jgi:hypothetical protein